ncbi:MAG TPA: efflux RND transporter periplasmic adaptor subunit [Chitinophagaceae bacterium]|nr:efflux RND transporter periplasmic adaptor subunit [Chitinophagaceae bacterium]
MNQNNYQLPITNYQLLITNYLLLILTILTLLSCNSKKQAAVTQDEPEEEHHAGNTVMLTEAQMNTANIQLGAIELKNLKTAIRANGMLSVPNQNKAFITSINSGVIRTLLIHPGNFVRKGQVVATIVNPEVAGLQQQLQTINAQLALAEVEYNRQKELVAGNAAPLKNVQRVQTELATLRTTRNSLQKQLSVMGISVGSVNKGNIITTLNIKAPISGTVSNVTAQIGSPVDVSTPIAEIVNNSELHLDLFIYEKDLSSLKPKQIIHFTLTNNPGQEYDAQIYSIGTAFATESKAIPVHAVVKGDKTGLIEGMSTTALISIGTQVRPAVPSDALVNFQGQDYIFILQDDAKQGDSTGKKTAGEGLEFKRIPVVKGMSDVGYTEITSMENLPPNARIIAKGAFFALAKMTNIEDEEH